MHTASKSTHAVYDQNKPLQAGNVHRQGTMNVRRWVDENHALAVFAHPDAAQQALLRPGKYKLKPFAKVRFQQAMTPYCVRVKAIFTRELRARN